MYLLLNPGHCQWGSSRPRHGAPSGLGSGVQFSVHSVANIFLASCRDTHGKGFLPSGNAGFKKSGLCSLPGTVLGVFPPIAVSSEAVRAEPLVGHSLRLAGSGAGGLLLVARENLLGAFK